MRYSGIAGFALLGASLGLWWLEQGPHGEALRAWLAALVQPGKQTASARVVWALAELGYGYLIVHLIALQLVLAPAAARTQHALLATAGTALLVNVLKYVVARERPFDADATSWPSGHAAALAAWWLTLPRQSRWFWPGLGLVLAGSSARVLHLRHWPADVVGGFAIALLVTPLVGRLPCVLPCGIEREEFRCRVAIGLAALLLVLLAAVPYQPAQTGYLLLWISPLLLFALLQLHGRRNARA